MHSQSVRPGSRRLRSRATVAALALTAFGGALLATACGPEFTDCHSRRRCADDGGTSGEGLGGALNADGGVPSHGGTAPELPGGTGTGGSGTGGSAGPSGGGAPSNPGGTPSTQGGTADAPGIVGGGGGGDDRPLGQGGSGGSAASSCSEEAAPPRLIAPLSTAWVTSRRPTVELEPGDDCGNISVDFCRDRACAEVIETVELASDALSARPNTDLPQGVVFWRARSGTETSATWQFTGGKGTPVDTWWGTIPDFNGDGMVDVAVGTLSGKVFVYYGSDQGLDAESPTALEIEDGNDFVFGAGLASAGDVNGDGFADLFVGAPVKPEGGEGSRFYVFLGGEGGVNADAFGVVDFPQYHRQDTRDEPFPNVPRGGLDLNADGYADFVITSPFEEAARGAFTSFFGSAISVLIGTRSVSTRGYELGRALAFCDYDGDRATDMLLGAPNWTDTDNTSDHATGMVRLFRSANGRFEPAHNIEAAQGVRDIFGQSVACADFASDGSPDAVVADHTAPRGGVLYGGDVLLFADLAEGPVVPGASFGEQSETAGALSGWRLATIGDMNADGFPELAVGHSIEEVRVFFAVHDPSEPEAIVLGGTPDLAGRFGRGLTGGDVNGDGLSDLIVSSPDYGERGRLTIFRGSRTSRIVFPSTEHIDAPEGITGFGERLSAGL